MAARQRVVIVGGGFGGLQAAIGLRRANVDVTLIDRRNFHLFQPLLYQVATGGLSPANICAPLRALVKRQKNVRVLLGEVTGFDVAGGRVLLDGESVPFDVLVVATGNRPHYFNQPQWEEHAPALKTIEDATAMRRRILEAFELAERRPTEVEAQGLLTFVLVGGGPTGVELAGAVAELARYTLRGEYRLTNPAQARVLLVEGEDRILPSFTKELSRKAQRALEAIGVQIYLQTRVTDVQADFVTLRRDEKSERVPTRTVLWAAGVQASPLGRQLATAAGAEVDRSGRVVVQPDLTIPGQPNVFVLGDLAHCQGENGQPLPGLAPVALQQGSYVARSLRAREKGQSVPPFAYRDRGTMATIGRGYAVANLFGRHLAGYPAWLAWLFIHLMLLVQFENRVLVFLQWAWNYVTRNRSARLITGKSES